MTVALRVISGQVIKSESAPGHYLDGRPLVAMVVAHRLGDTRLDYETFLGGFALIGTNAEFGPTSIAYFYARADEFGRPMPEAIQEFEWMKSLPETSGPAA